MLNYQPKVNQTLQCQDEHLVCKGKLILLQEKITKGKRYKSSLTLWDIDGNRYKLKPIIISETEEIEVGDWVYINAKGQQLIKQSEGEYYNPEYCHKILALPEHFSDKHLQAIVDGKMKDGDSIKTNELTGKTT